MNLIASTVKRSLLPKDQSMQIMNLSFNGLTPKNINRALRCYIGLMVIGLLFAMYFFLGATPSQVTGTLLLVTLGWAAIALGIAAIFACVILATIIIFFAIKLLLILFGIELS